jgi:hypothetical protein
VLPLLLEALLQQQSTLLLLLPTLPNTVRTWGPSCN